MTFFDILIISDANLSCLLSKANTRAFDSFNTFLSLSITHLQSNVTSTQIYFQVKMLFSIHQKDKHI